MSIMISQGQRDVLYDRLLDQLRAFNDVIDAALDGRLEDAERFGRRFSDALRLIVDGLGWGAHAGDPVELKIPPDELERIMASIREDAITQYEAEQPEQEAFRRTWERTAMVRDTCTEVLEQLKKA